MPEMQFYVIADGCKHITYTFTVAQHNLELCIASTWMGLPPNNCQDKCHQSKARFNPEELAQSAFGGTVPLLL